ncbi:MAG: MOSC domain-containing protein [Frankia sp.]|nr:MOSC domain-containing protein [Frankia sp.]
MVGPRIGALCRYPVKGLSPQPLTEVELAADEGVPGDRMFALALPDTDFDEDSPEPRHKTRFLMLQRDETLARVRTSYDPATNRLTVEPAAGDGERWTADLGSEQGRRRVEDFFGALAGATAGTGDVPGARPRLVAARHGHRFTDAGPAGPNLMRAVSVINLASVRDLAERIGEPVDPLRFRANVYLDGVPAWAERDWVGQEIGLGPVRARVLAAIPRCAATAVNPATAERDIKVVKELANHYGNSECGCYVQIAVPGTLRLGDPVSYPNG